MGLTVGYSNDIYWRNLAEMVKSREILGKNGLTSGYFVLVYQSLLEVKSTPTSSVSCVLRIYELKIKEDLDKQPQYMITQIYLFQFKKLFPKVSTAK